MASEHGSFTVEGGTFKGNVASEDGGVGDVHEHGQVLIKGGSFSDNRASHGGAFAVGGGASIKVTRLECGKIASSRH